tara:strand:- start:342 stop:461 length:120 start_codon:yes stop_codon:yes gene_type:complete
MNKIFGRLFKLNLYSKKLLQELFIGNSVKLKGDFLNFAW